MITEQADRCKRIVSGLLHFARQNKVSFHPTDLRDLVKKALQSAPAPSGIEVQVQHDLKNPMADLDGDQIVQVLVNLITNAYAAMPKGGSLAVYTSDTEAYVRVRLHDTGVGISPEHRKKIFEPFFTTKEVGKGTGLGLAVTYGIVKMHRGDIQVDSNNDPQAGPTGTSFTITLPRRGAE